MPVKRALNVGQEIYFLVKSFECGSRDLLAGQDLWMWDNISVSETRACQIHRFIGCFCLIEACDTCRPEAVNEKPQFDKVLVVQVSGEGVWCSRIRYSSGTWVSQMQIHSNFFPSFPIQTFKWNTNKKGVKSRLASDVERRWLAFSEAVGPKTSKCTILELSSLCDKLPDFIFNHHQTIASIASIADLTPDTTTPSHIMSQSSSLFPWSCLHANLAEQNSKWNTALFQLSNKDSPSKLKLKSCSTGWRNLYSLTEQEEPWVTGPWRIWGNTYRNIWASFRCTWKSNKWVCRISRPSFLQCLHQFPQSKRKCIQHYCGPHHISQADSATPSVYKLHSCLQTSHCQGMVIKAAETVGNAHAKTNSQSWGSSRSTPNCQADWKLQTDYSCFSANSHRTSNTAAS